MARDILIFGASYGALLAAKLAMAGHSATLVCRQRTAQIINAQGILVRIPVRDRDEPLALRSREMPGRVRAAPPEAVDPSRFDLAILAMQEPQYRAPGVRELVAATAAARVPCLSVMNMPPAPYLARIPGVDPADCEESYTDASVWDGFDPDLVTLCSPDPQAFRPPDEEVNVLEVRLPTNFKAARFSEDAATRVLAELSEAIEACRHVVDGKPCEVPVKLKVHDSVFVPLAKWAMLLAGNYRCLSDDGVRSIRDAVHSDLEVSRSVYEWVQELCIGLGASRDDLVPFAKYAAAAWSLPAPSSAARALAAGAPYIERVDRLVQSIAARRGVAHPAVDEVVSRVDGWLVRNRLKG